MSANSREDFVVRAHEQERRGEHVVLPFIPSGEPRRNGYVESFNGRVRDECLTIDVFWSLAQARMVITEKPRRHR